MYNGMAFDSEQEVLYYKKLEEEGIRFVYQSEFKKKPIEINLGRRKHYTPDFIVVDYDKEVITIVELKGYAKWSANEDDNICNFMKHKVKFDRQFLVDWLRYVGIPVGKCEIQFQRLKYNKTYGFVDYDWKNPNSVANQRKAKIEVLTKELKEANEKIKNYDRYFSYLHKEKLTKPQREWKEKFEMGMLHNDK
jgi:hypothetical protein